MRNFRITVDGQAYDVAVEELGSSTHATAPAARPAPTAPAAPRPAAAAPAPRAAAPKSAPAPKAAPAPKPAAAVSGGGNSISAPMPGVVLNVLVSEGQEVKSGDVLLILEAMKMENEVTAPADGTVKELAVTKGTSVNTGDLMVVIE